MSELRVAVNGTVLCTGCHVNANVLFLLCPLMPSRIQREVTNQFSLLPLRAVFSVWQSSLAAFMPCRHHHSHAVFERQNLFCLTFSHHHCYVSCI